MKKLIAILLSVLMLAICFSACENKENVEDNPRGTTVVSDEVTANTKEESTTQNNSDSQVTTPNTSETETIDGDNNMDWTLNY